MAAGFVHLDVRSFFSLKEGAFSPEQLAQRAAALGMPAVAMTDRDGLYGAARFVRACEAAGVRPILGASLTVRASGSRRARRAARRGRPRLREPLPAGHRRAAARRARRSQRRDAADLRARGRHDRGARAAFASGPARGARTGGRRRRARGAVPRCLRSGAMRDRGRAPAGAGLRRRDPRDASARRAAAGAGARHEPGPLPRGRRRVPGRRARVHAPDRPGRFRQRVPAERRGVPEAGGGDARAVRRTSGSLRRHARRRGAVRVRPRPRAAALPGLPDAGGPLGGRAAGRAVLARRPRPRPRRDRAAAGTAAPRALDDPADGVRGVLPDRRRHRCRREVDGHHGRVPRQRRRLVGLLPRRHLRRGRAAARSRVRAVPEPDARRTAGRRHRRRVGAPRGRLRHDPVAARAGARGLRRDDRHLPGARRDPRGRQGARPARGRGGRGREGVPAHLGAEPAVGARAAARAPGHQPAGAATGPAVPGRRTARRLPPARRAASLRDRAGLARPGGACAPRTLRERAPDGPGRQGRRRAARLPEARHPRRADALVDAARAGRDRAHHRREGRPRTDPARRSGHVRDDPRLRHARLFPDRIAGPARAAPEAPAGRVRGSDRRHLAVPARPGQVGHDPPVHRTADGAASGPPTSIRSSGRRCRRRSA